MTSTKKGPHLIIRKANNPARIYGLSKRITTIGRDITSDVLINDGNVSRTHARIIYTVDKRFALEDLNSTNGTIVNGKRVQGRSYIAYGDKISLAADVILEFRSGEYTMDEDEHLKTQPIPIMRDSGVTRPFDSENYRKIAEEYLRALEEAEKPTQNAEKVEAEKDEVGSGGEIKASTPHIFISYSRVDAPIMQRVMFTLKSADFHLWIDEHELEPGTRNWRRAVQNAIDRASCVIVILSPDAKRSEWVEAELDYAEAQNKKIFCVMARGDKGSAALFGYTMAQWVNIQEDYEGGMQKLLTALRKHFNLK